MSEQRMEVNVLVGILDRSFEEDPAEFEGRRWHSLISNLESVRPEDWNTLPQGAERPIRELVQHLGKCYLAYENHCFGDGTLLWEETSRGIPSSHAADEMIAWLRECHRTFRDSLARVTDEQLGEPAIQGWCDGVPRRDIVERMIQHGLYHAGEINHLRGTIQGNDAWD